MKLFHSIDALLGLTNPREEQWLCSAFAETGLDPTGSGSKGVGPGIGTYSSTVDTLATILADGYLDTHATSLKDNQMLHLIGTDGTAVVKLTVSGTTDVAMVGANVGPDAIIETIASTGSTATDLAQTGITLFTSTFAGTYNMPAPVPGQGPKIFVTDTTSAIVVGTSAADLDYGGNNTITFNGVDQMVELLPINSTQWMLRNIQDVESTAAVSLVLS